MLGAGRVPAPNKFSGLTPDEHAGHRQREGEEEQRQRSVKRDRRGCADLQRGGGR